MATPSTTYTAESGIAVSSYDGDELATRLEDVFPRFDSSVTAEKNRAFRHATRIQEAIADRIRAIAENYYLISATFPLAVDRSPNRYALPSDFASIRLLERIIDDSANDYERIPPVSVLRQKNTPLGADSYPYMLQSSATGRPTSYLLGGDFLQIYPISDSAYSMRIWYEATVSEVAAGNALEIPDQALMALVYGTAMHEAVYRQLTSWKEFRELYEAEMHKVVAALETRSDDGPRTVTYTQDPSDYV